jgi:DNA topoisomerase-2
VNYIADKVTARLVDILKKKNKGGTELKPAQIKNHISIFVNCLIENPTFDSQTKEFLTSRPKEFGSDCVLPENFMKKIEKSEVVENILSFVRFKQNQDLNKKGGTKKKKLTGIAKLDDANFAGSAKSSLCTLILTEGDSAKSLAMSGISVVGKCYNIDIFCFCKTVNLNHTKSIIFLNLGQT